MIRYLTIVLMTLTFTSLNVCADESLPAKDESVTINSERIVYVTPQLEPKFLHFYEHFDDNDYELRWKRSDVSKHDSHDMKYDGQWSITDASPHVSGDKCITVDSRAKHHAIAAKLTKPFKFDGESLIVQYEVQFRNGQECGGAYMKLLSAPSGSLSQLNDKTQYTIMFGPDKCGNDMKLHFIFNHKNPKNGTVSEKHWKKVSSVGQLDDVFKDKKWHQLRLKINSDNTYEVTLDKRSIGKGSLLEDFTPPVNPQKEMDDPNDSKPEDWDENEKIADPDASRPEDWDETEPRRIPDPNANKPHDWDQTEPETVPDPEAKMPADWDREMDGDWEPPLISNPKCKTLSGCGKWTPPLIDNVKYRGKWRAPMIDNPNYKGKWTPKKIPNPDFYEDLNPYKMIPFDAVAFELWTISDGISFDNILIATDEDVANHVSQLTYQVKKEISDSETDNWFVKIIKYTNKNPWMWALYLLVVGLPVVLFIAFCCVSPIKKRAPVPSDDAERKKTDEMNPDVSENETIEEEITDATEMEDIPAEDANGVNANVDDESGDDEPEREEVIRSSPRLRKMRSRKE